MKSYDISTTTEKLKAVLKEVFRWYPDSRRYTVSIHLSDFDTLVAAVFRGKHIAYLIKMHEDGSGEVSTYMPSLEYGYDSRPYVIVDDHIVKKVPNFSPETVREIKAIFDNEDLYYSMERSYKGWASAVNRAIDTGMAPEDATRAVTEVLGELP